MIKESNIAELAVAVWRFERWLNNLTADRKMAAKSALRSMKKYLEESEIEIIDPIGWKYDPGYASLRVINNEAPEADEDKIIVVRTESPIIRQKGKPIHEGTVILGTEIKPEKPNFEEYPKPSSEVKDTEIHPFAFYIKKLNVPDLSEKREWFAEITIKNMEQREPIGVYLLDSETFRAFLNYHRVKPVDHILQQREIQNLYLPAPGEWYIMIMNTHYRCTYKEAITVRKRWIYTEDE